MIKNIREHKKLMIESASGKDMDKLVNAFNKIKAGKVSNEGMISYGFDLAKPNANNEEKLSQKIAIKLGVKITVEDLKAALNEVGVKSLSTLVSEYLKAAKIGQGDVKESKSYMEANFEPFVNKFYDKSVDNCLHDFINFVGNAKWKEFTSSIKKEKE